MVPSCDASSFIAFARTGSEALPPNVLFRFFLFPVLFRSSLELLLPESCCPELSLAKDFGLVPVFLFFDCSYVWMLSTVKFEIH